MPTTSAEGDEDFCCLRCCPRPPSPSRCCDMCNPKLAEPLSQMEKPPDATRSPAQTKLPDYDPKTLTDADHGLREALCIWRDRVARDQWGPHHVVGGIGIIGNDQIKRIIQLARQRLIPTLSDLQKELKWLYMAEYGAEVLAIVHSSHPHPKRQLIGAYTASISPSTSQQSVETPVADTSSSQKKPRTIRCSACWEFGHNSKYLNHNEFMRVHANINALIRVVASLNCPVKRARLTQGSDLVAPGPAGAQPLGNLIAPTAYQFATPPHPPTPESSHQFTVISHRLSDSTRISSVPYTHRQIYEGTSPINPPPPYSSTAKSPGRISSTGSDPPLPSPASSSVPNQASPGAHVAASTPARNALIGTEDNVRPV